MEAQFRLEALGSPNPSIVVFQGVRLIAGAFHGPLDIIRPSGRGRTEAFASWLFRLSFNWIGPFSSAFRDRQSMRSGNLAGTPLPRSVPVLKHGNYS